MWRNVVSRLKTRVTCIFSINCHHFLTKHRRSIGFTNFGGASHIHDAKWQMFEDNISKQELNSFTYRTHTCGELRQEHNGQQVSLCGWVQYLRLSKFLLLRDAYGLTQCIIGDHDVDFANISLETIVRCDGIVKKRPKDMINKNMSTGEIEVVIQNLEILNTVSHLPFNLRDYQKPKEQLRLQHRYIDLRYPEMQNNLRLRSIMLHNMRKFLLEKHNFVEVETPTLFCRTPGGAREFVVPTHHPGLFYSLVQSPQQFKQILMSGGIDRYFQIARCYRDESTRPDRQPEFTQLDIELSFTNRDGVLSIIENLLFETFIKLIPKPPFARITYKEAMENYGTDKPNISYGLKLKNITEIFTERKDDLKFGAYAIPYPEELGKLTSKYREELKKLRTKYNVSLFLNENIPKELGLDFLANIKDIVGQKSVIIAFGDRKNSCLCLGEVREMLFSILKSKNISQVDDSIEPLWVVDFPLFIQGDNGLETCHHPFTAPHPEDIHLLDSEPLNVRSLAYDIVINGNEIGGGSVRVHSLELQKKIFELLSIDSTKLDHFLNALGSGCPPHAGIALGIDRLMSVACNTQSIRDVIAFPKSHDGKDLLSGAPNTITEEDMNYYHIASVVPTI